jgi:hypothetical protein
MNSQELIELTRQLIYHATHFDPPFVKETYADKFIYISVDEQDAGADPTYPKKQAITERLL